MIDESCYYTIGDLRLLLYEDANYTPPIINEAYLGRAPVAKMQAALSEVCTTVRNDPYVNLNGTNVAKKLETAICDTFGFNSCSIYWSNRPGDMFPLASGACTIVQSVGFNFSEIDRFDDKNFKNGYYDTNHTLDVIIIFNSVYIADAGLTDEEVMAVLLHEIGHNFDHTLWRIFDDWFRVAKGVYHTVRLAMLGAYASAVGAGLGTILGIVLKSSKTGREIATYATNIDNVIMDLIPPIGYIARCIGRPLTPIIKLFRNVKGAVNKVRRLGTNTVDTVMSIALMPIRYITSTPTRKSEQYADRFAATYGYSAEQLSGLNKLVKYMVVQDGPFNDSLLAPFYDLLMLRYDILSALYGDHGNNQQRAIWMMTKLDNDLKESGLTAAQKKIILKERDRMTAFYDEYVNADVNVRNVFTQTFRKMMDSWYNGKPYILLPNLESAISELQKETGEA